MKEHQGERTYLSRGRRRLAGALAFGLFVGSAAISSSSTPAAAAADSTFMVFSTTAIHDASSYVEPTFSTPDSGRFTSPVNYSTGKAYLRLAVNSKLSSKVTQAQVCLWRHASRAYEQETCSGRISFTAYGLPAVRRSC
jgi:hypothetical protein